MIASSVTTCQRTRVGTRFVLWIFAASTTGEIWSTLMKSPWKRRDQSAEHPHVFLAFLFHRFFFDPIKLLQPDGVLNLFTHLNEDRLVQTCAAGFIKTRE